ncbi:flagellar biosynthetic protein FliS [Halobacteroides halobius DSM 5150]|uniref:Flagellar secretion chaperone FliS n=1 Tax=Halobacteroides halobius (strain ATCC 35273 / DSM 5150 / MD-1) TaxID=748449 RepID=U3GL14_HALHC|nr:flagellar export chaperone FliS [Halobacteroides halobius]AGB42140.1 flagellar biosynthetic protein FliS [Halobacteroides halobius DSM 5150]
MANNPYQQYKNTQVQTANQEKLLLMLYDGAIKFTRSGKKGVEKEDKDLANNALNRAQSIISELRATLDSDKGGEIAESLDALYEYMNYQLVQANIKKEVEPLEEVLEMLGELKETWVEAAHNLKNKQQGQQAGGINIEG